METLDGQVKVVWAMTDRGDRTTWMRIGVAWEGEEGAVYARIDAVPLSGRLCIQPWAPSDRESALRRNGREEGGAPC